MERTEWLERVQSAVDALHDRSRLLALIEVGRGPRTAAQVAAKLGGASTFVAECLAALARAGLVERVGRTPHFFFSITGPGEKLLAFARSLDESTPEVEAARVPQDTYDPNC